MDDRTAIVARPPVRLPERQEIQVETDVEKLDTLMEVIEDTIIAMETQLEYSSRGKDWEDRAIGALTKFRSTKKQVEARLLILRRSGQQGTKPSLRPHVTSPQVQELFDRIDSIVPGAVADFEEAEALRDWVLERAILLRHEIEVERQTDGADQEWLKCAKAVLSRAGPMRNQFDKVIANIRKSETFKTRVARDRSAGEAFLAVAREKLDHDTYLAIWARVNELHPELG